MKYTILIAALAMTGLAACDKNPADEPFVPPAQVTPTPVLGGATMPPGHPAIGSGAAMSPADGDGIGQTEQATVLSTIAIEGFSYIEVKQHNQTRWLASKTTAAKKGDVIEFDSGSTMSNFESKVLDRTFPSMTFVNTVTVIKGK